jgi:hypothetical protein
MPVCRHSVPLRDPPPNSETHAVEPVEKPAAKRNQPARSESQFRNRKNRLGHDRQPLPMTSSPELSCREVPIAAVAFPYQLHNLLQMDRGIKPSAMQFSQARSVTVVGQFSIG